MHKNNFLLTYLENNIKIFKNIHKSTYSVHILTNSRCLKLPVWNETGVHVIEGCKSLELNYF